MDKKKYGKGTADALPADLAAVSLCNAKTAAAVGDVCLSKWNQLVADGRAPAPAIQQPRYTRWRRADVIAFWVGLANAGKDPATARQISDKATGASRRAREKRERGEALTAAQ